MQSHLNSLYKFISQEDFIENGFHINSNAKRFYTHSNDRNLIILNALIQAKRRLFLKDSESR